MTRHFPFENTYTRLPDRFYARVIPTPVRAPRLIRVNTGLALNLGLEPDWLAGPEGLEVLAGQAVPETAESIAMAYAGHQFGHFVPQLGDGRAILLGEVIDQQGVRRDVQLKGSGRTPFSRGGEWARCAGTGAAGICRKRSDGCVGHPDDAFAGSGGNRRNSCARNSLARRGSHARGGQPRPDRHVPVLRRSR